MLSNDYSPPDLVPGPTTVAIKRSAKQDLAHDANSGHSVSIIRVSRTASSHEDAGEIITIKSGGTKVAPDRRTVFDWPPSTFPLILRQPRGTQLSNSAPHPKSAGRNRYVVPCEERRSVDGGVRLAGGSPSYVRAI